MKKRAVIGITVDIENDGFLSTPAAYMSAVEKAGGIPIILPYCENADTLSHYVELCDGILFSGGKDISPERYGEKISENCGELALMRDDLEFRLLDEVLKTDKPILAICRGMQFINVAFGGTLYQDIPSEIPSDVAHRQTEPKFSHSHSVNVVEGTPLQSLVGSARIPANSFHHQAVKRIADGFKIMATADDGIYEAMYYTGNRYIRAYQWHPERLFDIDESARAIFYDFIKTCTHK